MIRQNPVFVTATCIIILLMHDMLSQEYQRAKKSEILALKNEAYQSEIDNMKNQELSIRRMRHDIKIDFLFMRCYLSWETEKYI